MAIFFPLSGPLITVSEQRSPVGRLREVADPEMRVPVSLARCGGLLLFTVVSSVIGWASSITSSSVDPAAVRNASSSPTVPQVGHFTLASGGGRGAFFGIFTFAPQAGHWGPIISIPAPCLDSVRFAL